MATATKPKRHTFQSSQFTYEQAGRNFTAEASSLGIAPGICPFQIHIVSAKTGEACTFTHLRTRKGPDDEIVAEVFFNEDVQATLHLLNT